MRLGDFDLHTTVIFAATHQPPTIRYSAAEATNWYYYCIRLLDTGQMFKKTAQMW